MKLYSYSPSPFARKVRVVANELNLSKHLQTVDSRVHPIHRNAAMINLNPAGELPTLVTTDGIALYDSSVICEYLDSLTGDVAIFPEAGLARWRALREQATGDTLLHAALLVLYERKLRPAHLLWQPWIDGQLDKIHTCLDSIEQAASGFGNRFDIGSVTLACALGYLDFRFPEIAWRDTRPVAASWFEKVSERRSLIETLPSNGG